MTVVVLVFCAVGLVAALSPTVDAFLSTAFVWIFSVGGCGAFVFWLGIELRDWLRWMDDTDPVPRVPRAKRSGVQKEAGRP